MRSSIRSLAGLLLLLPFFAGVLHAQALGPYEGEVPVASQSDADRLAVLPQALAQVLLKSGGADAARAVQAADAAKLLQQYRYRQEVVNIDGVAQSRLYLIARFDRQGVGRLLGSDDGGIWPTQRPQPVLWLALDDGSGARIVSQDAAAVVAPLTTRANQRGIGVRLPRYDAQEQASVHPRDLTGDETWSVDTATRRYGGPALLGWMRRGEDGWIADWRLRDGSMELGRWQSRDAQAAVVLAAGADGAADVLARRAAPRVFSGPPGRYRIVVEGLTDAAAYARVAELLERQPIVRAVAPVRLDQARLELDLELSAGVEGLAQLLRGSELEPVFVGDLTTPSEFAFGPP